MAASVVAVSGGLEAGEPASPPWDPHLPLVVPGAKLKVQPVLMYAVQVYKDATSYRNWGSIHTEQTAAEEGQAIRADLSRLQSTADFPLEVLPLVSVRTVEEARRMHGSEHDVVLVYPASGSAQLLKACFAAKPQRDTLIFARHRSGQLYYWYEALSTRYLKAGTEQELAGNNSGNHGPVTVSDVVIDDDRELLWKLRALGGLKSFIGQRIVALGGPMGKWDPPAPKWRGTAIALTSSTSITTSSRAAWPA